MSYRNNAAMKTANAPWIDAIPEHWDERPFFAVAQERRAKNIGMKEDNLLSLSYGNIVRKDINTPSGLLPESFETYQIIEADDVVFRLTDLQNDKRSLRSAICPERGIITSAYLAVRSKGVLPGFLSYLMRAYDVQKVFYSMGGGLRQSLGYDDLRRMSVVAPDVDEQASIARFLDRETTRIDTLIDKKTRFIELLKEKRAAVITHAVTKGLDPDVPMKDSGVEWVGYVPSHWIAMKFGRIARVTEGLVDPRDEPYKSMVLIAPNHIERGTGRILGLETASEQNAESGKYTFSAGTVIYSKIRPALAKVAVAPCDGLCSADMYPLECSRRVENKWLFYLMLSRPFTAWATLESERVAMPKINRESLADLSINVPPIEEQIRVVQYIESKLPRIDVLANKVQSSIDLLREKRSALITAAVTGKIDVRAAA